MFTHLRVDRSYVIWPNPKKNFKSFFFIILINNEPILTSTLPMRLLDKLESKEETTGGYLYRSCWKFFRFLALQLLSQNTNKCMLFRNVRTYSYIYIQNLDLDD